MAKRDPSHHHGPPDLRELAHRRLIDPGEMPTQDELREPWPMETAEVELLPTTTDAELPAVPVLAPPVHRPPVPVLSAGQARAERRRSSKWVGNLVLFSVGFGLLGGTAFAVSAIWYVEPTGTERWFNQTVEWFSVLTGPPAPGDDELEPEVEGVLVPSTLPERLEAEPRLEEAMLGDEVAFEDDEAAGGAEAIDEAPAEAAPSEVEPEPEPMVEPQPVVTPRPRPRRRPVPRPMPTASPRPQPTVRPYQERPKPRPPAPEPQPVDENGLIKER